MTTRNGYRANIEVIAAAAPNARFFNAIADSDGVVRSTLLLTEYTGHFFKSLALAMFRRLIGYPGLEIGQTGPSSPTDAFSSPATVTLKQNGSRLAIPVDERAAALVPFRGPGGPKGGTYRYFAAADVLEASLPPQS